MARNLTVTVAATALLFLFAFAYARSPLDLPEIDVARNDDSLVDLTEPEPKSTPTIILPSEKPESEPLKVAELESEETETIESKIPTATEKSEPNSDNDFVMPLTVVTFRPINRHFPRRPLIPFRRGHRCHGRHRHHNNFKPWGPQEVSYGNDMILSGGKDLEFDPVSRGGDRQMPARWTRFNHGGHRFSLINDESRTEEMNDKPHHHHHLHFRHHHDHEEEVEEKRHDHDHDQDHDHDHDHGFMKGIRKFLNHF